MPPFKTICLAVFASALAASAHAQGRELDSLHRALNLTPAQEADWRAFAAASAPDAEQAARDRSAQSMLPGLHAPQRVDLTIAAMQADLSALERRGAALKAFYAKLTPAQQAVFDRQTAPRASDERYAPEPSDSDPF
ncbi:MAG TPA: Spy/CpxP family protein refolding chaperone [Caulobacteraceae bacterium]|nr:Spy/CpxP family protein refolding chaperone [Caulobacteraceae bacterium]